MFDLVSVILPTSDRVALLTDQLGGLAEQTYKGPWELIVVDNGLSQEARDAVSAFEGRLPIRVVGARDRVGAAYARNCGAKSANGEYLFFIDDDDRVTPGWLEAMVRAAERWDLLRGQLEHFRDGRHGPEPVPSADRTGMYDAFEFLPSIVGNNSGIRRDLFVELGGFDERYLRYEDTQFYWRAQLAGHEAGFVADAVVRCRRRSGTRAVFSQSFEDEKAAPQLFREFRSSGMPRTSTGYAIRAWGKLVKNAPRRLRTEEGREDMVREFAVRLGRIAGSIRHRVLYL